MPKLWEATVASHREAVRDAVLDAAWTLVRKHGVRGVTMAQIAAVSGVGRATLYRYFPNVEAILLAAHRREIGHHVARLGDLRDRAAGPASGLRAVMLEFARICFQRSRHCDSELVAILHRDQDASDALEQVHGIFRDLLEGAVALEQLRSDVSVAELADFCIGALSSASRARDLAAVERLVHLTADGLRPTPPG